MSFKRILFILNQVLVSTQMEGAAYDWLSHIYKDRVSKK